jgi:GNAT superfamily N-acetyltransferase
MALTTEIQDIQIVAYRDEYAPEFARLNLEWLERFELLEDEDKKYLYDPETHILAGGGEIFFALENGTVIGTCAAIWHSDKEVELAKLAVSPVAQGRGLGRQLSETVIRFAEESGANKVTLISSTKLVAAIRLYEALGFRHVDAPKDLSYETADVFMELELPVPSS